MFDLCILLGQAFFQQAETVLYGIFLVLVYTVVLDRLILMGSTKTEVKMCIRDRLIIGDISMNACFISAMEILRRLSLIHISAYQMQIEEVLCRGIEPGEIEIIRKGLETMRMNINTDRSRRIKA